MLFEITTYPAVEYNYYYYYYYTGLRKQIRVEDPMINANQWRLVHKVCRAEAFPEILRKIKLIWNKNFR